VKDANSNKSNTVYIKLNIAGLTNDDSRVKIQASNFFISLSGTSL
jgi:hypothetical protein